MTKQRDPLGKRALFSADPEAVSAEPEAHKRGPLDVTIRCSACDARTTQSVPELIVQHFPLIAWMPGRRPGHLMRCRSCNQLAWHSLSRAV